MFRHETILSETGVEEKWWVHEKIPPAWVGFAGLRQSPSAFSGRKDFAGTIREPARGLVHEKIPPLERGGAGPAGQPYPGRVNRKSQIENGFPIGSFAASP
jgi:hypothetical protein